MTAEAGFALLPDRGVLAVSGPDRRTFLQGLVSNDVERLAPDRALHAALLTPQGKYLHDFFLVERDESILLDCEGPRREDLLRRLRMYRLRSKATVEDATERFAVAALIGPAGIPRAGLPAEPGAARDFLGGTAYVDPRLAALGARALLPRDGTAEEALRAAGFAPATEAEYDRLRLDLGVPDGSRDLAVERSTLLESNFDELNGVSWSKGCYVGQELTARMKYRALVRKRLLPVRFDGPPPAPGTPVTLDGRDAGEMRSGVDGRGLALLRLEEVERARSEGRALQAGEIRVEPLRPDWLPPPDA